MPGPVDIRATIAQFYDENKHFPDDLVFYRGLIADPSDSVLELGCGTGRVLLPLSAYCSRIAGVDHSAAMLAICSERLEAEFSERRDKVSLHQGDITGINLGERFNLITAPYRVFQNLDAVEQICSFFDVVTRHLAPGGTCILNVFRLDEPFEDLCAYWQERREVVRWTSSFESGTLSAKERVTRWDIERKVLYPELIYQYEGINGTAQELTTSIPMRCYYPDEFLDLIKDAGFQIINTWGGYAGEPYGAGPELIVQFAG